MIRIKRQIEAVYQMQDYIENNLFENITLASLSRISMFSPWYSYRLFVTHIGMTPADYIRKLRLSKSALKLRDNPCKIVDIAFEIGFSSVDGYQRAFRREFNCNPSEYAANPNPIYLFMPYNIKFRYLEGRVVMENLKNIFIQVIERDNCKVIIKRGVKATEYFTYCEEVGCDVWGLLQSIKSVSGEAICLWLSAKYHTPETSKYVQGVEVAFDYDGVIPDGFDIIELPATKYLMFQGEPFTEENFMQSIDEVQTSIKKYDPSIIGYLWDNQSPHIQLEPIGTRGYIELLPIKLI